MTLTLTQRQTDVLAFVVGFREEHGISPTTREIRDGCGLSSSSVADYSLRVLAREGLMVRASRGIARGWVPAFERRSSNIVLERVAPPIFDGGLD